jgi:hypothetical protein
VIVITILSFFLADDGNVIMYLHRLLPLKRS